MVEECRMLLGKKTPSEQKEIVLKVLSTMFVSPRGPRLFREQFGDKPGVNALITPIFFQWLVGPSAVNDSPETDAKRTGVLIEKCRFLDESGCKGLCLNMCQQVCRETRKRCFSLISALGWRTVLTMFSKRALAMLIAVYC